MSAKTRTLILSNSGDIAMLYFTIVSGMNFVVLQDAVKAFSPLTFNAVRLSLGALVLIPFLLYRLPRMKFDKRDLRMMIAATLLTLPLVQILMVNALTFTSSSNVALMSATGPAWTVLLLVFNRSVQPRTHLFIGLVVMFLGAGMVILSRGSGFAMSQSDITGCAMMLTGAFLGAWYTIFTKPIIDRCKVIDLAFIKHLLIAAGVVFIASPELVQLPEIPSSLMPNLLFGGIIASVSGTMTTTFALRKIGPTRMKVYDNIIPVSTAVFAFFFLHEPITALLIVGGGLTLYGVRMVRRNSRPIAPPIPALQAQPTA